MALNHNLLPRLESMLHLNQAIQYEEHNLVGYERDMQLRVMGYQAHQSCDGGPHEVTGLPMQAHIAACHILILEIQQGATYEPV